LGRALCSAREGIDVFYSRWDWWYLGLAFTVLGTADASWLQPAAGRMGFSVPDHFGEGAQVYGKLRQYPWNPNQAWSGNFGGHYGTYQQNYLRAYVLPLFHGVPAEAELSLRSDQPTANIPAQEPGAGRNPSGTKVLFPF
jgi:hypothetical protein